MGGVVNGEWAGKRVGGGWMYRRPPSILYVRLSWLVVDTGWGLYLGYRHPLGSLRPFVARFRLTYYDVWSAPAPLGFVQGAVALLTGERNGVSVRRPRFMLALWSGRGGCYSYSIRADG